MTKQVFSATVHLVWIGIISRQELKGFVGSSNKWKRLKFINVPCWDT